MVDAHGSISMPASLPGLRQTGLPLFSIIITCFNKAAYIEEAISSAINQHHDSFEVVVVDDGSHDDSWEIIQKLASWHSILTAGRHRDARNLGEGASRELGLTLSRGHFILYLDGDDRLLPGRLRHDEEVICRHPGCSSVISRTRYFHQNPDSETRILCDAEDLVDSIAPIQDHLYGDYELFLACFYDLRRGEAEFKGIPCVGSITTSRSAALSVPWQKEFTCAADICYFAEVLMKHEVYCSSHCLHEYRLTTEGAWFQARKNESEDFWQRLTKRHIDFLALAVEPARLHAAQSRLEQAIARRDEPAASPPGEPAPLVAAIPREPICPTWGLSRGQPVDRYYVDRFLSRHSADITGHVMEIGDDGYSRRFGSAGVTHTDVLDVNPHNPSATIIADLAEASDLSSDRFDCIIATQVMEYVPRLDAALRTLHRICRPGGVLLCTFPAISRVSPEPDEVDRWYWSVYPPTARLIFREAGYRPENLCIDGWGNLTVATAFLWGLAQEDLSEADFRSQDPGYPVITSVRAVKGG
jgi:SAM-dependent methyltransferase